MWAWQSPAPSLLTLLCSSASESEETCLVVMIGLPGAGKSTVSREMHKTLALRSAQLGAGLFRSFGPCAHIEFDAFEGAADFAAVRERGFEATSRALQQNGRRALVIVDDNQFYSSMRKEYRRLALAQGARYLQVYIQIDLDTALHRNALRDGQARLDEDVIRRMHGRFDEPSLNDKDTLFLSAQVPVEMNARTILSAAAQSKRAVYRSDVSARIELPSAKQHEDKERKERIRAAVLHAKAQGIYGEELNRIALGEAASNDSSLNFFE